MRKLLMMLLMTGMAGAQTIATYTGVIKDLAQQVVTSGQVAFTLTPASSTTIPGTGTFTPSVITCNINVDGTLSGFVGGIVSGGCNVTMNTAITPGGTSYKICIQPYFSTPGSCFFDYAYQSKDITTVVPTLQTGPLNYSGIPGPPIPFLGIWNSATVYTMGQAVSSANAVYISLVNPNLNHTPASSPTFWSVVQAPASLVAAPTGTQTVTQPVNTNFNFVTSGTGSILHNGNPLNYLNYLFSGNNVQPPTATTGRTWANPEFYYAVNDNSTYSTNPNPQGDLTETPIIHIESFNNSPNDVSPIYLNQVCSATVEGNPPNNNGCVGLMAAVSNTPTSKAFLEAANFIMQINSTDPLVQGQGVELNAFNNSGSNSLLQATNTFTRGPYLGFSATAGGANKMVAGYHATDQGGGSGWQYGFWSEQATDANFMAGLPGGGNGSQDALQVSPQHTASVGNNSASMPIDLRTESNDGTINHIFATFIKAIPLDNSTSPVICANVSFTSPGSIANICNDGSLRMSGTSWRTFAGVPSGNCSVGDFATNASATSATTAFYTCFPANTWITGSGSQTVTTPGCAITAGTIGTVCNKTATLSVPQPDTNYSPVCSVVSAAATVFPFSLTTTGFSVQEIASTTTSVGGGTITCFVIHN
jgi:hypothetical protein